MSVTICIESSVDGRTETVYEEDYSYNEGPRFDALGLHDLIYHPAEAGLTRGRDLIAPVESALESIIKQPGPDGLWEPWFVTQLYELLCAAKAHPEGKFRSY